MLGSVLHGIAPASTWALELVRECNSPAVVHEANEGVQFPGTSFPMQIKEYNSPAQASQTPSGSAVCIFEGPDNSADRVWSGL